MHSMFRRNLMICVITIAMIYHSPVFSQDNAQFISCTIPDTLVTDQVFEVKISMKNTGTTTWDYHAGNTPVTLVSKNPKFNKTWGTYFIIMGQGNTVAPGDTFTFQSRLKAPKTTGSQSFCWQIERWIGAAGSFDTTTPFFGDSIPNRYIFVTQSLQTPPQAPLHRGDLLDSSDLEYMGSFIPPNVTGQTDTYTESGLALKDGNLLVRTGTYNFRLYETTIPQLVKITGDDYSHVNSGVFVRDWGELEYGTIGGERIGSNCGFWYDDSSKILYWSHHNPYFTGGPDRFPQLMATRLDSNGSKSNVGYWHIPVAASPYKSYWGGPLKLSRRFASTYTNGRDMGLGFGGHYSICGTASRGPALGAIARPNPANNLLDLVPLVAYDDPAYCIRDNSYLPVVTFWDKPFPDSWRGAWTYDDYSRAGVFIDLPDKRGYLAFVYLVTGRIGYDYGGYNTDGHWKSGWYFYDLDTLGKVAQGIIPKDRVQPSSYVDIDYPLNNGLVYGACFDSASRMVYVYVANARPDRHPMIHCYRISTTTSTVKPSISTQHKILSVVSFNAGNTVLTIQRSNSGNISQQTRVRIFDLKGKLVATLFDGSVSSPIILIPLNKTAVFNQPLSAGIYLINVQCGKQSTSKRITMGKISAK